MDVKGALERAAQAGREKRSEATSWDARLLLAHALRQASPLSLDPQCELDPDIADRFEALWERCLQGVPVQHLIGEWDFYSRPFLSDSRALIPRGETEVLLREALREAPSARWVLDAGTGSGVLAVSFLLERPEARAIALDSSLDALALARANSIHHSVLSRIELVASDWLSALAPPPFDLVLSNPPYLSLGEAPDLPLTVRDHDPRQALFSGRDGLAAIRHLLDEIPPHLQAGCPFLFEIGFGQAAEVEKEIRSRNTWRFVRIEPDLAGIPRVAIARRPRWPLSRTPHQ